MMMLDRRTLLAGAATGLALSPVGVADAQSGDVVALWPGRPPGALARLPMLKPETHGTLPRTELWLRGIGVPTLTVYRPQGPASGIGVLIVPGGGYEFLSIENEGSAVAERLAGQGHTAFVLTYRLPAEGWQSQADVPLQDAQRAMRLIRAGAAGFGVDPARLGVVGFSAGGHLAASLATAYDERVYSPVDGADAQSARPARAALMYAVTTLELPETHRGTREHLLGDAPGAAAVARRSPLRHLDARTPPCFVLHAFDDPVVPVSCSTRWMEAAQRARVPIEAHFPAQGGHGFGMHLPESAPASLWPDLFDRWVRAAVRA